MGVPWDGHKPPPPVKQGSSCSQPAPLPANPTGRGCFLPHHPTSICRRLPRQRLTHHPSAARAEETSGRPRSTTFPQLGCRATRALPAPQPGSNPQGTINPHHVPCSCPPASPTSRVGRWMQPLTCTRGSSSHKGTAMRTFAASTTPYPANEALKEATTQEEHPLVHRPRFSFPSRTQHRPCQGAAARRAITHLTRTPHLKAQISSSVTGCWSQNRTEGDR